MHKLNLPKPLPGAETTRHLDRLALRLAFAFLAGLAFALGQPPWSAWYLALPALAAAVWLGKRATRRADAGLCLWVFGLAYFGLSMLWITEPFFVDAAVTGWMAPFALIGLAGGLSLFWGVAGALAFGGGPVMFVLLWTAAELIRTYVLTGFPWGLLGYTLAPTDLVLLAAFVGPHGLTLVTLILAAGLSAGRVTAMVAAVGFVILWGAGHWQMPAAQDLSDRPLVRMVQPNAPQHQKWDPAFTATFFQRQVAATAAPGTVDLIVWPETALPMLLHQADAAFGMIGAAAGGTPVVVGLQRFENGYFNSLVVLDGAGQVAATYDKHHLVPFGEYIPLAHLFTEIEIGGIAARARGGFSAGPGPRLIDTPLGAALPLICYEAVFPQDVLRTNRRPAYLLQITNDAWFGSWSGPYQHLMQARLRAIETGLPMVRVANTGVSAMIDPAGRIIASLPLNQSGYLDAGLPRAMPPTLYARTGDLPMMVFLCISVVLFCLKRNRKGH